MTGAHSNLNIVTLVTTVRLPGWRLRRSVREADDGAEGPWSLVTESACSGIRSGGPRWAVSALAETRLTKD